MARPEDVKYKTIEQLKLGPKKDMDSKLSSTLRLIVEILVLSVRMFYSVLESLYKCVVPPNEKSVAGDIALITGTGHGMGRELALQLSTLGATVVCVDINQTANEETVKLINNSTSNKAKAYAYSFRCSPLDGDSFAEQSHLRDAIRGTEELIVEDDYSLKERETSTRISCDVSDPEQVKILVEKVKNEVGIISILINNAGIMPCHRFFTYSPEEVMKIFGVNVFAHIWLLQGFLPDMIKRNHGHVVSMSSIAGVVGIENLVPYCASKFAVRGMIEALHEEIRTRTNGSNVKFTIIYPYMVDTGLCQKPVIRFPSILSMVSPRRAASEIIRSFRRNELEHSIPSTLLGINNYFRLLPQKTGILLKDFLGSTVDEHDVQS